MKYPSFFLMATISLTLMAFAPFGGSTPLAPIEVQNVTLQNPTVRIEPAQSTAAVAESFTVSVMIDDADDFVSIWHNGTADRWHASVTARLTASAA